MSGGVTWGSNTVHTIGGAPAPASSGFSFGTPSPSPAPSAFGAPAPSAFGAPSTAPATGGFGFGSTAKPPAAGGGLFGTPAPAPGAFGTASSFGSFGQPKQPQQPGVPQHHIPAQAAMEAKITAERVVEASRIRTKIEKLHREYSGTCVVPEDGEESAKFVAVVYNEITPEERQLRMIHGMATGQPQEQGMYSQHFHDLQQQQPIFAPQRPPQINSRDWKMAVVNNPDPNNYVPTPIIGAVALQGRVSNQQTRAKAYADNAVAVQKNLEFIRQRAAIARQDLMEKDRQYATLRRRLLELMMRVEVARCLNKPLQPDEYRVMQRLTKLLDQVEKLRGAFFKLQDQAKTQSVSGNNGGVSINTSVADVDGNLVGSYKEELVGILKEQRRKLEKLNETAKNDLRDVGLIARRVVVSVPASIPH
ncbi:unnamed protein product [Pseudo-nitzschia multistriata]|uniref:Nucleoporin Nup54 alpha-helical domain-containing protein n=1 Tax=Pseudo-nitzschia multistriata TaxID=183589 RepID=A0A448Z4W8_9STRA|nr:unnamed protein product [Pseudo-nitzschia multistriata]